MKTLSFIIPAYNSQSFLERCVSSMLAPEILDCLEIIIVNDGSTDATAQIAESFCRRWPNVVRLISQENRGHGGAVNTGCAAASGKYLKVIDADDWVEQQNLPAFLSLLDSCDSDVILTHYHTVDMGTGEVKDLRTFPRAFGIHCPFREIVENWSSFEWGLTFHGITYRTDFYRANAAPLPEHVYYEDHAFAAFPCCRAKSLMCFDLFVYDYRVGDGFNGYSPYRKSNRAFRRRVCQSCFHKTGAGVLQRQIRIKKNLRLCRPLCRQRSVFQSVGNGNEGRFLDGNGGSFFAERKARTDFVGKCFEPSAVAGR